MAFALTVSPSVVHNAGSGTVSTTGTISTTVGNLVCVAGHHEGGAPGTTITISDSQSNTWNQQTTYTSAVNVMQGRAAYCVLSSNSASHTFSSTYGAAKSDRLLSAAEFSAADTINFVSEGRSEANGVTSLTSASLTLDGSVGMMYVSYSCWSGGTGSAGGDGTVHIGFQGFCGHAYKLFTSSGAKTAQISYSASSEIHMVAMLFREGAASGGGGSDALSGSAATGGLGTQAPGHSIGL